MARSGKTAKAGEAKAFDFSLGTKKKLKAQQKEWVLANSDNLCGELKRLRDKIDWDALRDASDVEGVNAAFSAVDRIICRTPFRNGSDLASGSSSHCRMGRTRNLVNNTQAR